MAAAQIPQTDLWPGYVWFAQLPATIAHAATVDMDASKLFSQETNSSAAHVRLLFSLYPSPEVLYRHQLGRRAVQCSEDTGFQVCGCGRDVSRVGAVAEQVVPPQTARHSTGVGGIGGWRAERRARVLTSVEDGRCTGPVAVGKDGERETAQWCTQSCLGKAKKRRKHKTRATKRASSRKRSQKWACTERAGEAHRGG